MDEVGEKLNWLCVNRNNKGVSNYRFNAVAGGIDAAILRDIEEKHYEHYELVERYENEHRLRLIEEGNIAPLRATIEAKDNRIAALEQELAAITHIAMTADPAGWWIAPRGSSDPSEWICVEEMDDEAKEES